MSPRLTDEDNSSYEEYSGLQSPTETTPKVGAFLTTEESKEFRLPVVKEFRDSSGKCVARDVVTIYFKELLAVTKQHSPQAGAILVEAMHPTDLYVEEFWIPKKLCSNLQYDADDVESCKNNVKVWRPFAEDKLDGWWE